MYKYYLHKYYWVIQI